jgi:hypothetical protein
MIIYAFKSIADKLVAPKHSYIYCAVTVLVSIPLLPSSRGLPGTHCDHQQGGRPPYICHSSAGASWEAGPGHGASGCGG